MSWLEGITRLGAVDIHDISALHSSPLIAAYTNTPHFRLVGRLDLSNLLRQSPGFAGLVSLPALVPDFFNRLSYPSGFRLPNPVTSAVFCRYQSAAYDFEYGQKQLGPLCDTHAR